LSQTDPQTFDSIMPLAAEKSAKNKQNWSTFAEVIRKTKLAVFIAKTFLYS